jgi:uncharacterized protein (TIGR02145 family)
MATEKLRKRIAGNRIYATVAEKDRNLDNIVMADKADKVGTGHGNNVASFDSDGNLKDSGVAASSLTSKDAAEGGTALSLVTTGEKYTWNNWKHDANITIPLPKDTIEVKGHLFKYVQIGNLLVTTKNLDIPLGTVGTDCFWFKDDQDTYGDYGMYYRFNALGTFEYKGYYHPNEFAPTQEVYDCIYSQGWRIWTDSDFDKIVQAHGHEMTQDNYKAMCSTTGWKNNPQGTNELGFNAMPTGERAWDASDSSGYNRDGTYFCMRVIRTDKCISRISPSDWYSGVGNFNTGASIRLVKDVTA